MNFIHSAFMSTCPLPIVYINCHYILFLSVVKRSCLPILSILILLKHTNCQLKSNSNIMFPVHDFDDRNVGMMYAWSLHFQRLENLEEVIKSFCKNFVFKNVEMHCIETASTVKIFYFSTTFNGKYGLFLKFIFKHISNLLLTHLSLSANNKLE